MTMMDTQNSNNNDDGDTNNMHYYPTCDIAKPHPHDVLCGRGGFINAHEGNKNWRRLVQANKELYVALPKYQKQLLSHSIVHAVRNQSPPGRFLQKDPETELWHDIGNPKAYDKTSQALREDGPQVRSSIESRGIPPHSVDLLKPNTIPPGARDVEGMRAVEPAVATMTAATNSPNSSSNRKTPTTFEIFMPAADDAARIGRGANSIDTSVSGGNQHQEQDAHRLLLQETQQRQQQQQQQEEHAAMAAMVMAYQQQQQHANGDTRSIAASHRLGMSDAVSVYARQQYLLNQQRQEEEEEERQQAALRTDVATQLAEAAANTLLQHQASQKEADNQHQLPSSYQKSVALNMPPPPPPLSALSTPLTSSSLFGMSSSLFAPKTQMEHPTTPRTTDGAPATTADAASASTSTRSSTGNTTSTTSSSSAGSSSRAPTPTPTRMATKRSSRDDLLDSDSEDDDADDNANKGRHLHPHYDKLVASNMQRGNFEKMSAALGMQDVAAAPPPPRTNAASAVGTGGNPNSAMESLDLSRNLSGMSGIISLGDGLLERSPSSTIMRDVTGLLERSPSSTIMRDVSQELRRGNEVEQQQHNLQQQQNLQQDQAGMSEQEQWEKSCLDRGVSLVDEFSKKVSK